MGTKYSVAACDFCWRGDPKSLSLSMDDAIAYALEHGWIDTPRGIQCPACQPESGGED